VSGEELLQYVQKLPALSSNPSLLRRVVGKVKDLSDVLSPYFESVGMIIQSNPEFAAIAWGAFRLVLQVPHSLPYLPDLTTADILQLASNFTTFFDKLVGTLEQIGQASPQYRFLPNLLQRRYQQKSQRADELYQVRLAQSLARSVRIKKSICGLYKDILSFLLAIVRVFTKKDGCEYSIEPFGVRLLTWSYIASRSSTLVVSDLFWRPYDLRFKDLLE
jgi:hypothetical protein